MGGRFSAGKHFQSALFRIFLAEVFLVCWEVQENMSGIPCRLCQPRFTIKLNWLELREQELPSMVSQHVEVHRHALSFGHWA